MNARPSRTAWLIVAMLFAGSVLNYIDRSMIGVIKPLLQKDLSLTNTDYGLAVNAFLATYTLFYILGGRLADLFGYRHMFTLNVAFWSVAGALHTFTRGLGTLALFRGLLGIGEGCFYPAAIRAIAHWFPPEERAKGVGILLCGLTVGTVITPPALALVTHLWGWRTAFLLSGLAGLLLLPPWMLLHARIPPEARPNQESAHHPSTPLRKALFQRKYLCFLCARAVTDAVWLFYLFWIPGYFQEVHHFNLEAVGKLLWIPFFCANAGALAGAWITSGLVRVGWSLHLSRKTVLLAGAGIGMLAALTPFAGGPYVALALVGAVLFGQFCWATNVHTTITDVTPREHMAVLYGITGATGNGVGALAQPLIGRMVDTTGYNPAFFAAACAYFVAILFVLAAGRIEPVERSSA